MKRLLNCLFAFALALAPALPSHAKDAFLLLDDIGQSGKPDTASLGFTRVRAIPTGALWPKGADLSEPNFAAIKAAVQKYQNPLDIICLDIEHWSTSITEPEQLPSSLRKLISVAEFVKHEFPDIKVGYYSMVPSREYSSIISGNQARLAAWQEHNDKLTPLANSVDIIFPSLYAFNHDTEKWKKYAKFNLLEAKQYGKPVIAFLWPQIHESNHFDGLEFVDYAFWKTQLEVAYQYADGIIIWTPWGDLRTQFDPSAGWWKATEDFIKEHKLNGSGRASDRPRPPILQR